MTEAPRDRIRGIFSLFTPGQVAMIGLLITTVGLLGSILLFVWNISSSFTEAKLTLQNSVEIERLRAIAAESQLSLRIDNTIATVAHDTSEIKSAITEIKNDVKSLTTASTPTHR